MHIGGTSKRILENPSPSARHVDALEELKLENQYRTPTYGKEPVLLAKEETYPEGMGKNPSRTGRRRKACTSTTTSGECENTVRKGKMTQFESERKEERLSWRGIPGPDVVRDTLSKSNSGGRQSNSSKGSWK